MKIMSLLHQLAMCKQFVSCSSFKVCETCSNGIVQIINNIEDEKTFSTLTFMKFYVWNWLVEHLDTTICMFVQHFCTKNTFLFQAINVDWNGEHKIRIRLNAWSFFAHSVTCFEIWCDLYYNTNFVNCYGHFVLQ